ncbi:MAG: AraC family transcriptional regulator ligand-binding domain-containing protein [Pseudomonadota bacterium]
MNAKRRTIHANISQPKVSSSVVATTVAFALSRGLTLPEIEAKTGISPDQIIDPNARLPDESMVKLWNLMTPRSPEEVITLEMARAAPLSFFGGLAHASQFAGSLRESLNLLMRTSIFVADRIQISIDDRPDETAFVVHHPLDRMDRGRTSEVGMALISRHINEELGFVGSIKRVEFGHERVGPRERYLEFFGTDVLFDQPNNAIVFHREHLDKPLRQSSAELFAYVQQHYEQALERIRTRGYSSALLKLHNAILDNARVGEFGVTAAAEKAHISLRSAQRLAEQSGTSLQALIDEVRADVARELLSDRAMTVQSVSSAVGYSDDRAFRRAFKRWTGKTTTEYRADIAD